MGLAEFEFRVAGVAIATVACIGKAATATFKAIEVANAFDRNRAETLSSASLWRYVETREAIIGECTAQMKACLP